MQANTKKLGFSSSIINASSPFAERELTLSEIDSMYQNGEIDETEAKNMAIRLAFNTNNPQAVLVAVCRK